MRCLVSFVLVLSGLGSLGYGAEVPNGDTPSSRADAENLTILGDKLYRNGRFGDAQAAYEQALALDAGSIPARLGLGRIADLLSEADLARTHYAKAFQTNPAHPGAVLAFASVVTGEARETLLDNFLALNHASIDDDQRNSDVKARLEIERKLAGRSVATVADPHREYHLPLSEFRTNAIPTGLMLRVRINGGRPLNLQLDSGAQGLVLNPAAGRAAGLEMLAGAALFGFGSAQPTLAWVALAATVEADTLKIANVLVEVSDTKLIPQGDGLIGLEVFKDFVIRLNARSRRLDLEPFEIAGACGDCNHAYRVDHLLLLHGNINGQAEGNFILDTGSPINLISRAMVTASGRTTQLAGAQGNQEVGLRSTPVNFHIGPQSFLSFDYATLDTERISAHHGTAIAGAIGYSLLRDLNVMVDYRRGLVKLSK
jgi:tetratricopeptide (TPR) repeat protein